jgi:dGTPase
MKPSSTFTPRLSGWRRRDSTASDASHRTILEEAHSDRGRVVFSASFRRLAQKTQVFALSLDGARTRLTHSLEVAHIGTYIVDEVFKKVDAYIETNPNAAAWKTLAWNERSAVRSFVEVACLVHDIGNPPFGHFGEKAICNWFKNGKGKLWLEKLPKNLKYDFSDFDGNKQGFRILTKLQRNGGDSFSLNLTATQLAATIKYPVFDKEKPSKCSYFEAESSIKKEIWTHLQLKSKHRHPLSLLMEAADDIAYCVSDLEDAAEKGLVSYADLNEAFGDNIEFSDLSIGITKARTKLTNQLVGHVATLFLERILKNGVSNFKPLLAKYPKLTALSNVTAARVYSSRIVLSNEITGFKVIHGLLDAFESLLAMDEQDFAKLAETFKNGKSIYTSDIAPILKSSTQEPSLLSLFPKKHIATYLDNLKSDRKHEKFHRMHLLVDFVAGMTDDFALDTYRLLSGQVTYAHK